MTAKNEPHRTLPYCIAETEEASTLGKTKIYQLIKSGKLETVKIGRRTLIKAASLHKLLEDGT